jgi:hypothetical protein
MLRAMRKRNTCAQMWFAALGVADIEMGVTECKTSVSEVLAKIESIASNAVSAACESTTRRACKCARVAWQMQIGHGGQQKMARTVEWLDPPLVCDERGVALAVQRARQARGGA